MPPLRGLAAAYRYQGMLMLSFLPELGGLVQTILAFLLVIVVIVSVHEYGHFIVGRWCGIHAEVFSIGMGRPWFKYRDRRGTIWQFSPILIGGYVRFAGDADPASAQADRGFDTLTPEQKRRTMHGAPAWARAATLIAGPAFNFVLSIVIFAGIVFAEGTMKEPFTVGEVRSTPFGNGLAPGDEFVSIEGVPYDSEQSLSDFFDLLPVKPELSYEVVRDGKVITVDGPYPVPAIANSLVPRAAAYRAGMQVGDIITEINGTPIIAFSDLKDHVEASGGAPLVMKVWRDGAMIDVTLKPKETDEPLPEGGYQRPMRIGIVGAEVIVPQSENVGVFTSLWAGVRSLWRVIASSLSGLYHMAVGTISSCNLNGAIGIAEASGAMAAQGSQNFLWFVGVLSAAIGVFNLLPVPVLDGGQLTLIGIEVLTGRTPGERMRNAMIKASFLLVAAVMIFALANDIFCP